MELIFAGSGGQGIKKLTEIVGAIFTQLKKHVAYIVDYDSASRGGEVRSFIVVDDKPIANPVVEHADIMLVLYKRRETLTADTILYDETFCPDEKGEGYNFIKLGQEKFGKPVYGNMIALGVILKKLNIDINKINLRAAIPKKLPDDNIDAVKLGYEL